jgi:4-hydroxy-2-oxoheptanedioate aldolase
MAAGAGWDWLLLDMEHVAVDVETVERHVLAAAHPRGNVELMVRIPSIDPVLIKGLLDAGVRSFMVPFVQTVEEARLAVAATRYPPAGIRGFAGTTRANHFGRDVSYTATYAEDICVVIQIESPQSVANIPAFGAVDGVDGMLIGMSDLAANLGLVGQRDHSTAVAKFDEAGRAIMATGKAAGFQGFDVPTSQRFIAEGYTLAAVSGDIGVLLSGMAASLKSFGR